MKTNLWMRRKKGKRLILFLILLPIVSGVIIYYFFPQYLLAPIHKSYEWKAGVKASSLSVEGYEIPFYEGGEGEPLVLIHGFGGSKISFVQTARWLTPHYRVILPEVPGFGATKRDLSRDHSIRGQVQTLYGFFNKLGIRRFHLGGNSMGGHISVA